MVAALIIGVGMKGMAVVGKIKAVEDAEAGTVLPPLGLEVVAAGDEVKA